MYKYIHICIYIHIYMSAHIHTYTYMHTHIQNVHMKRTQARLERRRCSEALHFSFVRRNQPTFRTSNARTSSLYPRPAALIPLHPPSSLPNIPQNSSKLAQLYTGPLRSCRKIGGKAVVQQSCSKRTRRNPSPKMIKVTVHEETRSQWKKRPNPATAHKQSHHRGEQTTSRSSALVRGQSTQFIANPCRWPQRPSPKGYISFIFPPFSVCNKVFFFEAHLLRPSQKIRGQFKKRDLKTVYTKHLFSIASCDTLSHVGNCLFVCWVTPRIRNTFPKCW